MTSSRILCTNTIQLFVDEWCKFWCRWYRFHILFIWFCHSFCPFFRQTTQTIHISLWNYNSECYIANCCCWPAFFCLRLTLPTLKCPCLFAYSLISWKNLTPWMNRINELGWVSFHTIVHFFPCWIKNGSIYFYACYLCNIYEKKVKHAGCLMLLAWFLLKNVGNVNKKFFINLFCKRSFFEHDKICILFEIISLFQITFSRLTETWPTAVPNH